MIASALRRLLPRSGGATAGPATPHLLVFRREDGAEGFSVAVLLDDRGNVVGPAQNPAADWVLLAGGHHWYVQAEGGAGKPRRLGGLPVEVGVTGTAGVPGDLHHLVDIRPLARVAGS